MLHLTVPSSNAKAHTNFNIATTILGGTGTPTLDTLGQLLATQLASLICSRNPDEGRMLVLGLGLRKEFGEAGKVGREEFAEMVGGVLDVL